MRYIKHLALVVAFLGLCGFGGGGGGGGGGTSCSGDINAACSQVTGLTHAGGSTLDNVVIGGSTPVNGTFTNINRVGALGSITDGGTATCNWANGSVCTFSMAGAVTLGAPSNPTANSLYWVIASPAANFKTYAYNSIFKCVTSDSNGAAQTCPNKAPSTQSTVTYADAWWYDGTSYWQVSSTPSTVNTQGVFAPQIKVGALGLSNASNGNLTISTASAIFNGGTLISNTGGTSPTATCSGGSTGVVVSAGNSSCTGSAAPFPCCTGSGAGHCSNSTDNKGMIQTSSSASTSCTITFNHTWPQSPACVVGDGAASITPTAVSSGDTSTTTFVMDFASATSKVFNWVCM